MIKRFLWKFLLGLIIALSYYAELLFLLMPIEAVFHLGWERVALVGSPFVNGALWFVLFIVVTLWNLFIVWVGVIEPES